ncbi:MAG: hopanoid-associated sugar epimerase, partial [Stellaceae bacterium]
YVLGGENLSLAEMLQRIAAIVGRSPPKVRLPLPVVWPVAAVAEAWGRLTGGEPMVTFDSLRMARKKMYFSAAKAERELGYSARPANEALADAIQWFRAAGMVR